jgi:hypothetical protein
VDEPNTYAESVRRRTWSALMEREDWSSWLRQNVDMESMFSIVQFEDRPTERLVLRGDTVSYYVPTKHVQAAYEMKTLATLMGEVFRRVYVKWAEKKGLPAPPPVG